jgi:hypothetical protein
LAEIRCLANRVVARRFQLDFGLQPLLLPVMLQHPGQRAVACVVVHLSAGFQVSVTAELVHAHS